MTKKTTTNTTNKTHQVRADLIKKYDGYFGLEIYENDKLVWSHLYLGPETKEKNRHIVDLMLDCHNWRNFEGCEYDKKGNVRIQDVEARDCVALTYDGENWKVKAFQGEQEVLLHDNEDRIPAYIVIAGTPFIV